jgi:hypothetical protein
MYVPSSKALFDGYEVPAAFRIVLPDASHVYYVRITTQNIGFLVSFLRYAELKRTHGADYARAHGSRCFCFGEINFETCGVSPENETAARKATSSELRILRRSIRHGSVAALDAHVALHGAKMSGRARLVTELRRSVLVVIEAGIAIAENAYVEARAEFLNSVVLTPTRDN